MSVAIATVTTYLSATDSRDKMIKGAGCLCKLVGALSANADLVKTGGAMSDARCIMRMLSWLGNIQKLADAMEKRIVKPRDVLFVLRVLFDGIFSLLDNVAFTGRFLAAQNPQIARLSQISRASLFYGYVAAVMIDIMDLASNPKMPNRGDRQLVLTRNACDMVSAIGNVCALDIGAANVAGLGLLSAIIATREQIKAAYIKTTGKSTGTVTKAPLPNAKAAA